MDDVLLTTVCCQNQDIDIGTILLIQVQILFGFHQFYMHAFFQLLKKEIIILSKRWLKKIKENFGGRKPGGKFQLCHLSVGSWAIHLNFLSLSFFLHKMEISVELLWGLNNLYEHIMLGHCCNRFVEKSKLIRVWTWRKQFVFPVTEINWMFPSTSLMTTWAGSLSFSWKNLKPGLASGNALVWSSLWVVSLMNGEPGFPWPVFMLVLTASPVPENHRPQRILWAPCGALPLAPSLVAT